MYPFLDTVRLIWTSVMWIIIYVTGQVFQQPEIDG